MMKLQKFTIKDIVFIAILSAALALAGLLVMPLVMSSTLFGLRNMASAILYSILVLIGLMKVRKIGTLTLIGLFHGSVLLMMSPVMFWNMIIGGFVSELITWLIFRSYDKNGAKLLAATLFIPLTIPVTLVFTMLLHGQSIGEILNRPVLSGVLFIATILLSYAGARIGYKIGCELQRAGKL
ncbi:glucan phosphoethanolaminetransferase (alkaline phosphatase superfamily) [Anaerotaenia torta]|uniref:hypothetical protein n=1 Tax=Anaerotaenia torta TaxID=433293 RepID=UPI003D1CF5C0